MAAPAAPTLTASPGSRYPFYRDGVAISGAVAASLFINSGSFNGSYTVVVTNANGCAFPPSAPVAVAVTAVPLPSTTPSLIIYPTLTHHVQVQQPPAATSLQLLDGVGREVRHLGLAPGATTVTLPLDGLAAGSYVLRCGSAAARVVIE